MIQKNIFFLFICILAFSCQTRKHNHITYLNKVNEIDSIYRLKNDTLTALKMYQTLFKTYSPYNSELIDEYQTYIILSDKYHEDFGGKESLYKLISLVAPNWKYNRMDKSFFALYKKYGIDSLEIEEKVTNWKRGLNKRLVDSFSVASFRDQEKRRRDAVLRQKNDEKNEQLLLWTFKNYGYPSLQKIGLWGNNDTFMSMSILMNHAADSKRYPYFKEKLLEYIKTGECIPDDYAAMIDKYSLMTEIPEYGTFSNVPIVDSVRVNKNRKKIGLPSLKHAKKIHDDYFKN
ncbi:hypothetical protein FY557_18065 [Chryseobacterium sp. SN22]|uniref:hypothetical protein n=1 Tax=Chryseobacterium sp. SN22 TaxID=2606431 RepID=UPI0011EC584F|nr:hypothetical protein [Chryseobacterium sp. SN22]KAA0126336.1 hypothetical protein FY557_18065 [Chryseobacterium sp. SN22]